MWTTKYRPKTFDEIIGNKPIIDAIKAMMPNIPHMLFRGKAGVGKTTTALVIVNELQCDYKELNASDNRKIDDIRNTVKNFAMTSSIDGKFKVIILDECDALTDDAQGALRRIMEKYQTNCRFILTCNNPEKLIEPLKSRCKGGDFEFQSITFEDFSVGINKILSKENMTITPDALMELHKKCKGDMRIVDTLYQLSTQTKNIIIDHILKIKEDDSYKEVYNVLLQGNYLKARKIIKKDHVPILFDMFFESNIDDEKKIKIIKAFAEFDYRKNFAINENIQLCALLANIIDVIGNEKLKKVAGVNPFKQ